MQLAVVLLFVTVCVIGGEAAARFEPSEIHPGHEKECYVHEIRGYLKPGKKRYLANCSVVECTKERGALYLSFLSCGVVAHHPSCTPIPTSRFAVYPECCIEYDCPPGAGISRVG
ncbi:uncharacterized protein LOC122376184 [Amphibalanus amphitrite]|uniref:uncharacterized protein LOC122376184 n=1 Tax=Amphibalanus amphitrite TaxID=1232801 RepID=UPI001C924E08|nr:uncharacterized protein LOC122376184 [Amphibalanus amphitrite]